MSYTLRNVTHYVIPGTFPGTRVECYVKTPKSGRTNLYIHIYLYATQEQTEYYHIPYALRACIVHGYTVYVNTGNNMYPG